MRGSRKDFPAGVGVGVGVGVLMFFLSLSGVGLRHIFGNFIM